MAAPYFPPRKDFDQHARVSLEKLEAQFLSSLQSDDDEGQMLSLFYTSYLLFQEELQDIHRFLSPTVKEDIANFATMVVTASTNLVEVSSPTVIEEFRSDLMDAMLAPQPNKPLGRYQAPRFIKECLQWLRENLHNPYPSKSVRNSITRRTQSCPKDVDAWFVDIRKRIGWSQLRHLRFGNRKADIVDAATRFFTGSDPHRPLESVVESEFADIASTVEQLFYEKCARSALASHLDESVKDLTPDLQASLSKSRRAARSRPYPTPERSPASKAKALSTPEPPSLGSPPEKAVVQRKKRARSPSTDCQTDIEEDQIRPTKRLRHAAPLLRTPPTSCYPSPAASIVLDLTEPPVEGSSSAKDTTTGASEEKPPDPKCEHTPPSPEPSSLPTSTTLPSLSPSDVLAQATTSSPSISPAAVSENVPCDSFSPFDPFSPAFMHGGLPIGDISLSLPPFFNIADDNVPTNVLVDFNPSWSNCNADELALPSVDASFTRYDLNFDSFGIGMYDGAMGPFSDPLWSSAPQLQPLASTSHSGPSTSTLSGQLSISPPSPTGIYEASSPSISIPSPAKSPSDLLADIEKERELMELEARCAALRSELASRR